MKPSRKPSPDASEYPAGLRPSFAVFARRQQEARRKGQQKPVARRGVAAGSRNGLQTKYLTLEIVLNNVILHFLFPKLIRIFAANFLTLIKT